MLPLCRFIQRLPLRLIDLNNNEIERTARELIEGSKLLGNQAFFVANFKATMRRVLKWCEDKKPQIKMALVEFRSTKVVFYFVPQTDRYDLALGDEMTALEVELAGSAGIGYVESLQVPERSLERFAGPTSLLIWKHADVGQ